MIVSGLSGGLMGGNKKQLCARKQRARIIVREGSIVLTIFFRIKVIVIAPIHKKGCSIYTFYQQIPTLASGLFG
jgi:hypothetical protein